MKPQNRLRERCKALLRKATGDHWDDIGVDDAIAIWGSPEQVEAVLFEVLEGRAEDARA